MQNTVTHSKNTHKGDGTRRLERFSPQQQSFAFPPGTGCWATGVQVLYHSLKDTSLLHEQTRCPPEQVR